MLGVEVSIPTLPFDAILIRSTQFVDSPIVSVAGRNIPTFVSQVQEYEGATALSLARPRNHELVKMFPRTSRVVTGLIVPIPIFHPHAIGLLF